MIIKLIYPNGIEPEDQIERCREAIGCRPCSYYSSEDPEVGICRIGRGPGDVINIYSGRIVTSMTFVIPITPARGSGGVFALPGAKCEVLCRTGDLIPVK